MRTKGIYVHIPFCMSKCRYCNFNSYPIGSRVPGSYIQALVTDIQTEGVRWRGEKFASVYIGGGTPSLLTPCEMEIVMGAVRACYLIEDDAEITVECNPCSLDLEKLSAFADIGVTRLSIGVQSMCDSELAILGRTHTSCDAIRALRMAGDAGFANTSADILLGIPGQRDSTVIHSLDTVVDCVSHLSIYILSLEHGTELEKMVTSGAIVCPDDDEVLSLYQLALDFLQRRGFERYEISNLGLPGYQCRHNQIYWQRGDYAGLGAGAHSHKNGLRYAKMSNPRQYVALARESKDTTAMWESLTTEQMLIEDIMLGLRTTVGIDLTHIERRYRINISNLEAALVDLIGEGHIIRDSNTLRLSPSGILLHDSISEMLVCAACPA